MPQAITLPPELRDAGIALASEPHLARQFHLSLEAGDQFDFALPIALVRIAHTLGADLEPVETGLVALTGFRGWRRPGRVAHALTLIGRSAIKQRGSQLGRLVAAPMRLYRQRRAEREYRRTHIYVDHDLQVFSTDEPRPTIDPWDIGRRPFGVHGPNPILPLSNLPPGTVLPTNSPPAAEPAPEAPPPARPAAPPARPRPTLVTRA